MCTKNSNGTFIIECKLVIEFNDYCASLKTFIRFELN